MLLDSRADSDVVLIDAESGHTTTVHDVRSRAAELVELAPTLTFLVPDGSVESWLSALALLEAGAPVALVDPTTGLDAVRRLLDTYQPDLVLDPARCLIDADSEHPRAGRVEVHPALAVMLTTSGTTGSPRFVRLSTDNLLSNANQIARALALGPDHRAVTTMPLSYSFGLSVMTSHAVSGGSLVVSRRSVIEPQFWDDAERHGVNTLAGVPITYRMLKRLGFADRTTTVRTLVQAGGRLDPALVEHFHETVRARGGRFFVMYGQTEASPRMCVLPADLLPAKAGSVGLPLPGGRVRILDGADRELPPGDGGRVVYDGPNVMMGYATSRDDLALGDVFGDVLDTGDVGYLDEDGCLHLTGRTKRICKLSGVRVSLDEVEALAATVVGDGVDIAVLSPHDDALVLVVVGHHHDPAGLRRELAVRLKVPPKQVLVHVLEAMPRLSNGKVDYRTLAKEVAG